MKIYTTEAIRDKPIYTCIYAVSGMGKTSLAKTLPAERTLIIDAEGGLASLHGTKIPCTSLNQSDTETVTIINGEGKSIQVPKPLAEEERYEKFKTIMKELNTPEYKSRFDYIFIDSLTEIGQNVFKHMQLHHEGFKLWGEYTNAMLSIVKYFRDLDHYNVIFVALEGRIEDDLGVSTAYPDIGGKKAKEYLLPAFDLCCRMIVDAEKKRWLVTQSTAKTQAKDRSGKLAELEEPNLQKIFDKIKG